MLKEPWPQRNTWRFMGYGSFWTSMWLMLKAPQDQAFGLRRKILSLWVWTTELVLVFYCCVTDTTLLSAWINVYLRTHSLVLIAGFYQGITKLKQSYNKAKIKSCLLWRLWRGDHTQAHSVFDRIVFWGCKTEFPSSLLAVSGGCSQLLVGPWILYPVSFYLHLPPIESLILLIFLTYLSLTTRPKLTGLMRLVQLYLALFQS